MNCKQRRLRKANFYCIPLAGVVAMTWYLNALRKPQLEWFVSPPYDKNGRRVRILYPKDWVRWGDKVEWSLADGDQPSKITFIRPEPAPQPTYVEYFLAKLKVIPGFRTADDYGQLTIAVGKNAVGSLHQSVVDGKVYPDDGENEHNRFAFRAFKIAGSDLQVSVMYNRTESLEFDETYSVICESLRVE